MYEYGGGTKFCGDTIVHAMLIVHRAVTATMRRRFLQSWDMPMNRR